MADESTEQLRQATRHGSGAHKRSIRDVVIGGLAFEMILWVTALTATGLAVLVWVLAR